MRIADIRNNAAHVVSEKVPAAHLDDRTETAIEGATAGCFDDVYRPAQHRVALEHSRIPPRGSDFRTFEAADRTIRIVAKTVAGSVRQSRDRAIISARLDCADRKSTRLNSSHSQISYAVFC